jgi:hypothetical protein
VASRFPFKELPRYIAGFLDLEPIIFTLEDESPLIINIVHTASPISEQYFSLRNDQLVQMAGHLGKQ